MCFGPLPWLQILFDKIAFSTSGHLRRFQRPQLRMVYAVRPLWRNPFWFCLVQWPYSNQRTKGHHLSKLWTDDIGNWLHTNSCHSGFRLSAGQVPEADDWTAPSDHFMVNYGVPARVLPKQTIDCCAALCYINAHRNQLYADTTQFSKMSISAFSATEQRQNRRQKYHKKLQLLG